MERLNLHELRCFLVIAEEGHITRASLRLGMQQPPLSRLLQNLERKLGTALMYRETRGVRCTAAGDVLAARAAQILADVDGLADQVLRASRGESGSVAVGFTSSSVHNPAISTAFRSFRDAFPDVGLSLNEAGSGELIEEVVRGTLDAAFVRTPLTNHPDLRVDRLLSEPMVVVIPDGHRLAKTRSAPLRMADLAAEPFILYRRQSGPGLYDAIIAACRQEGFVPMVVQEAPRLTSTIGLVSAGLGLTILPASMASLHTTGLTFREIKSSPALEAIIALVTRIDDRNPALTAFCTHIRASCAKARKAEAKS
jgi:DNA-binding transcriptional LysR family regulator